MSKADRDDDEEYCHECAQCGEAEDCTALEWQACEGKGNDWYCCQDCADAADDERELEVCDEAHREDDRLGGLDDDEGY